MPHDIGTEDLADAAIGSKPDSPLLGRGLIDYDINKSSNIPIFDTLDESVEETKLGIVVSDLYPLPVVEYKHVTWDSSDLTNSNDTSYYAIKMYNVFYMTSERILLQRIQGKWDIVSAVLSRRFILSEDPDGTQLHGRVAYGSSGGTWSVYDSSQDPISINVHLIGTNDLGAEYDSDDNFVEGVYPLIASGQAVPCTYDTKSDTWTCDWPFVYVSAECPTT